MKRRNIKPDSTKRRITKADGRLADYSSLKTATGIVIPEVRKVLLDRVRKDDEITKHRHNIIYPSEMAKSDWCPRATYYRMTGHAIPPTKSSFTLENVFNEGNMIHNKWQNWMSSTGKLWGDWRCSRCSEYVKNSPKPESDFGGSCVGVGWVDLRTNTGTVTDMAYAHSWQYKEVTLRSTSLPVSGHADGALTDHNILVELKSLGVGSLRFEAPNLIKEHTHETKTGKKILDVDGIWKEFHRPLTTHIRQGNIYLWMAKEMGLPFDKMSFVYEFKSNQQAKEFVVPFSQDIINPLLDKARLIQDCVEHYKEAPDCAAGKGGCTQCRPYERKES